MGGEDHPRTLGGLPKLVDEHGAQALQPLDHKAVVYDLVAHIDRGPEFFERQFDDADGPVDAGAEAARRCQQQCHLGLHGSVTHGPRAFIPRSRWLQSARLACESIKCLAEGIILGKSAAFGLASIALLLLWGCETESDSAKEAGGCPTGAALAEASTVTKLRPGGGKDLTDVVMTAELAKPKVSCDYDKDENKVSASFSFPVTVKRGPAATNAPLTLSYFAAVVDADNNVLTKQTFTRDISLDQNATSFSETPDGMTFTIPKGKKPVGYEVLVGFQLTRDELAYNRERHRYIP